MKFGISINIPKGVNSQKKNNPKKEYATIAEELRSNKNISEKLKNYINNLIKKNSSKNPENSENSKNPKILAKKEEELKILKKEFENFKIESEKIFTEKLSEKIKLDLEKKNQNLIFEIEKDKIELEKELQDRYDHFEELNLHITNLLKEKKNLKKSLAGARKDFKDLEEIMKEMKN